MPYIASNNGLTIRWHDPSENYVPKAGEVSFSEHPDNAALGLAFPAFASVKAAQDIAPQIDTLVTQSYQARLRGKAALLNRQGKTTQSLTLLIKSLGG